MSPRTWFFAFLGLLALIIIIVVASSIKSLEATEYGLDYSRFIQRVNPQVYKSGLYFLGLGHTFLKFPRMVQTLEFTTDEIESFTSDGLPVILGLSFQFQLIESEIFDLYQDYGMDYMLVYMNVAKHLITEVATNFTAYDFFTDQGPITLEMTRRLQMFYSKNLHCTVEYLQLRTKVLPVAFEEAIQETIVAEQNITKVMFEFQAAQINASTQVMQAQYEALITILQAEGEAIQYLQIAQANANATGNLLYSEMEAYSMVKQSLNLNSANLNYYVWLETLGAQNDTSFYIGMQQLPLQTGRV